MKFLISRSDKQEQIGEALKNRARNSSKKWINKGDYLELLTLSLPVKYSKDSLPLIFRMAVDSTSHSIYFHVNWVSNPLGAV